MTSLDRELPKQQVPLSLSDAEFIAAARRLHRNGWHPIPAGKYDKGKYKVCWVGGVTGEHGIDAPPDEFDKWPALVDTDIRRSIQGILAVATRMPKDVIGIDVDGYDGKEGFETLKSWTDAYGPLPSTFKITARFDGSGILLYRIPPQCTGWRGESVPGLGVELLQRHHRYAMVPPSWHHTGKRYRLFTPEGKCRKWGILPPAHELPYLPTAYLDGLEGTAKAGFGGSATDADVEAFAQEHRLEKRPDNLDLILTKYDQSLADSPDDTHNPTFATLCWAAREARAGCFSWNRALDGIRQRATRHYKKRARSFDARDFHHSVADAIGYANTESVKKLKARVNRDYGDKADKHKRQFAKYQQRANQGVTLKAQDMQPNTSRDETDGVWMDAGDYRADDSIIECLEDIEPVNVEWIWKGYIPKGKLSIAEGESDVGKSTVTLDWAQIVSNGNPWPITVIDGKELKSQRPAAGVVLVGVEDGYADTVVPRLIVNGANRKAIFRIKRQKDENGEPVPFTIPDDIYLLRKAITEANAELCVIDPITAYLPEKVLHGVDASIRRQLTPLAELADETGCAIVLIRHFNKDSKASAKNRGGGSVAYGALVRSVMQFGALADRSKEAATHAITVPIGNLTKKPNAIGYRFASVSDVPGLPKSEDDELGVAKIVWCGAVDISPDQLLGLDNVDARKVSPMLKSAMEAVTDVLKNGPQRSSAVIKKVREVSGAGVGTIQKASKELNVVKKRVYKDDGTLDYWNWTLPELKMKMIKAHQGGV